MFFRHWEKEIEAEWEKEEREDKGKPQRPKIQLSTVGAVIIGARRFLLPKFTSYMYYCLKYQC